AYDQSSEDYHRDEERVIRYLLVETSKLRRLLPVDEDDLKAYYEEHKDEFVEGEQAHARHILFRVPPDATPEQDADAKLRAEAVARMAAEGADFAELAAKHSEDPGSKDNGGDLGWFGRGRMVPEFEEAVFGAKPGDIVGPVKSQFGYHVIRVEGFRPEHQRPFDEVEEQVRFKVTEGRASAEAELRAAALARRLQAEQPEGDEAWQAIADEDEAVVLNQSPPFVAGTVIPGIGEGSDVAESAFSAEVGDIRGPVAVPRGWIVWQLEEIRPEGIAPFEEVRAQVEQKLKRDKAIEIAAEQGRLLADRWREGEDGAVLAEEFGSSVSEARDHRRGAAVGAIGVAPALDNAVFDSEIGVVLDPVTIGLRGVVVVKVLDLTKVSADELDRELDATRSQLMAEEANQLLFAPERS
ncbi:MAG: peptidyl-prolyl cis-trans isomerase, partial [Acidobacteriota bacterium]